jgi:uncharacterized protein YkwD
VKNGAQIFILFAALLTGCGNDGGSGRSGSKSAGSDSTLSAADREVLALVNESRASARTCGEKSFSAAAPLQWDPLLKSAAQNHSSDMDKNDFLDHEGSDGSKPNDRALKVNYDYALLAENIAYGTNFDSAEPVMTGWLRSPGHCANIMNPKMTEIGVASSGEYWTMVLGKPQ